jgi:dihydroorotase
LKFVFITASWDKGEVMQGTITIKGGRLVLPDRVVTGDLIIEDGTITGVGPSLDRTAGEVIDATGLTVMPGVIDPQVHFRDPGLTYKECLSSGSRAAASGGVTAFLDMPNTKPSTTTVEALQERLDLAATKSVVHYGFFIGATGSNLEELNRAERTPGIKIFMGSSTGDLLVSNPDKIAEIFEGANKLIAVHAEDEAILTQQKIKFAGTKSYRDHPRIRSVEAAMSATNLAIDLSQKHGQRLHVLHVSSVEEADLLSKIDRRHISAEVCPQHLFLHAETAYDALGARAQCNPPVRTKRHADGLMAHLKSGTFTCIATDHAPHTADEKSKPYPATPSGMPGVEWSLPLMLDQVNKGAFTLPQVAALMCEGPAKCYSIPRKGRLEIGFDGDIVLVDMNKTKTITDKNTRARVGWTPYAGWTLTGWPVLTAILGTPVFRDGEIVEGVLGKELTFSR